MMLRAAATCNVRPMRAVLCKAYGPPESLVVEEIDEPMAGPGQIVVDVKACAINFPDVLMIQDLYQFKPPLPFSPGGEIAGVVSAVGEGVDGFSVGEAVFSGLGSGGLRREGGAEGVDRHPGASGPRVPRGGVGAQRLRNVVARPEGPRRTASRARPWSCSAPPVASGSPRWSSAP